MTRRYWWLAGAVASSIATAVVTPSCDVPALCDNNACTDGGVDGPTETGPDAPPNCNASADPKDSPACVADGFGIFVDATNGKDANSGTKESPVQTIAHALDVAKQQSVGRLYVCEGTYAEDLTLDSAHDGISIYGGWKCADWSYSGNKPVIGKTQNAATITSVTKPIAIEDLEVNAIDGDGTVPSSIAVAVRSSSNVQLLRMKLVAGKGHAGVDGTVATFTFPAQATLNGNNADAGTPGAASTYSACPGGGTTVGGAGGISGVDGDPGSPGDAGAGGTVLNCINSNAGGGNGAVGVAGPDGAGGQTLGKLDAAGWLASKGLDGKVGTIGQGGGGGAGLGGGGGGGGGAGGCGGALGTGGTGGGASIALSVFQSTVSIGSSALATGDAGNGGAGKTGQPGQTPGGFHGNGSGTACSGGNGGAGGNGGSGGGGAGGISVGVLWKGTSAPTIDSSTQSAITIGAKGTKGSGGAAGNDGVDGAAQAVLQAP